MKTTITALCNQKGGVGKTTSCLNLGVGLAQEGKKVLLVDCDPQGSLMISKGCAQPDSLQDTLSTAMLAKMMDTPYDVSRAILRHGEGVDILPANIELSGVEVTMVNAMSREKILKQTLEPLKEKYDHTPLLDKDGKPVVSQSPSSQKIRKAQVLQIRTYAFLLHDLLMNEKGARRFCNRIYAETPHAVRSL